jgi:tripartite-type tricarboxylate transporter receptor subunit TctC
MAILRAMPIIVAAACGLPAHAADTYPTKPVTVIVPFPPGAGVDIVTRLVAAKLSMDLGQQFVIENRSGAGGNIGAGEAARAAADGYTLLAAPSSLATSQSLYKNLPFKVEKNFRSVAMMASAPFILVVNPKVPVKNVAELIALAKAKPDTLNYASTGNGSSPHLTAEMFSMDADVKLRHVPYRGTGPAMNDLISGLVDMMFGNALSVLPQVRAGQLRALATTSAEPDPNTPDLPTVQQAGVKGFESATWFALMTPTGTPDAIVERLNQAVARVMQLPDVQKTLQLQGATAGKGTPAEVDAYVKQQIEKFAVIVKAANVHID